MLFLASPLPADKRQERRERLHWMTELLKHHHQVKKGLGVATEAGEDAGRSYDYVHIEGEPVESQDHSLAAKELFTGSRAASEACPERSRRDAGAIEVKSARWRGRR